MLLGTRATEAAQLCHQMAIALVAQTPHMHDDAPSVFLLPLWRDVRKLANVVATDTDQCCYVDIDLLTPSKCICSRTPCVCKGACIIAMISIIMYAVMWSGLHTMI